MYSLKIIGFKTQQQVEEFIRWYEGQGEQDAATWFECRCSDGELDVDTMNVNLEKTFPIKFIDNETTMVLEV